MSELGQIQKDIKQHIYEDYIAGMDVKDIAAKYGFKHTRTCYYHLNPLSHESKLQHMLNRAKRLQGELAQEQAEQPQEASTE